MTKLYFAKLPFVATLNPRIATLLIKLFISDTDGIFVKLAPLIAGRVPVNFDAVKLFILSSATVPVNCAAGILVKFTPLPVTLPLKLFAVTIPETIAPVSEKVTVDNPLRFIILFTLISDAILLICIGN